MDEEKRLPQEIIDEIVDNFSKDFPTLKNIALASRALLSRSRSHLFSSITLDQQRNSDGLQALLTENPALSTYIRIITLTIGMHEDSTRHTWLSQNSTLPLVLDRLTSLCSFSFNLYPAINWKHIDPRIAEALFRVFALPTLSSIHFTGLYGIPDTFFNISASIQLLELRAVTFNCISDFDAESLQSLSVKALVFEPMPVCLPEDQFELLPALVTRPNACFARITRLRIYPSDDNLSVILPILKAAEKSLVSLELVHTYMALPYAEGQGLSAFQFNLANLSNLSWLSITIGLLYSKSNHIKDCVSTSMQQLTTFLASATYTLAHIEKLTVIFSPLCMHPLYRVRHMAKHLSELDVWEQLDTTISHCRSTAGLRVILILMMKTDELTEMLDMKKEWQESMPGKLLMLENRGSLTLDMETYSQARI